MEGSKAQPESNNQEFVPGGDFSINRHRHVSLTSQRDAKMARSAC